MRWLAYVVITYSVFACSATAAPAARARANATPQPGECILSAEDLARYSAASHLSDALERVRPALMRTNNLLVSVGGSAPTELSILSTIAVAEVAEVRLVRASTSAGISSIRSNGDVLVGDVLLVVLRKQ
jgi:hypothetical protein